MIKPGFVTANERLLPTSNTDYNKSVPYDSVFPSVQEVNNTKAASYNIKEYRKMVRDNFETSLNIKNTRFGFIPPSYNKDTFQNFTAQKTSGMFMNNSDRYTKDANRHTIFQKEEKSREFERFKYRTASIQKNTKWVETRKDFDDIKKDMKGKAFSSKEIPAFIG